MGFGEQAPIKDWAGQAESIQREFVRRFPLIDWRVGWDGPEVLMIRAALSINDPMELEQPQVLRQVTLLESFVWDTATVDMYMMIAGRLLLSMGQSILDWKRQ